MRKNSTVKIFLSFFLGLYISCSLPCKGMPSGKFARIEEFDDFWRQSFPNQNFPPQENLEKCYRKWLEAENIVAISRTANIPLDPDYAKNAVYEVWAQHYYREAEEGWFLPFLRSFADATKEEIQLRVNSPETFSYRTPKREWFIGQDDRETRPMLKLISGLHCKFDWPLISLNQEVSPSYIYATVVFRMQSKPLPIVNPEGFRRLNDHAALIVEYVDEGRWQTIMSHYRRKPERLPDGRRDSSGGGASSGGKGTYIANPEPKDKALQCVVWNLSPPSPPAPLHPNHTHVYYMRYATFTFERSAEAPPPTFTDILGIMKGQKEYIPPLEYSMRGKEGCDNCCTYVARTLEVFALCEENARRAAAEAAKKAKEKETARRVAAAAAEEQKEEEIARLAEEQRTREENARRINSWPNISFRNHPPHKKRLISRFTADDLREVIDVAHAQGAARITLMRDVEPEAMPYYMTAAQDEPIYMPSLPLALYQSYWRHRTNLRALWEE